MMTKHTAFWDDLAHDLEDPEFLREYIAESMRIATIDAIVNALDDAREAAGLSKAELARAIKAEPATIRRLLSSTKTNPTLGTLAEVAAALGLRITLEPLPKDQRAQVTAPLLDGRTADPNKLARHLDELRTTKAKASA
ncbi:DNA-binding protein [Nocardioides immobilis]|nr:helix-turn-helix transcriptional regulator [Nocardioides immobilis]